MDLFSSVSALFRMTDKMVIMHQQLSAAEYTIPRFCVNGTKLKTEDNLNCLGGTMSRCIRMDDEVDHRIAKSSQALRRFQNSVWNRRGLQMDTKLKIYNAVVLTTLRYRQKTWSFYSSHTKKSTTSTLTAFSEY
nr:unnamed protein product [Spirometra erinaceieuropaei]